MLARIAALFAPVLMVLCLCLVPSAVYATDADATGSSTSGDGSTEKPTPTDENAGETVEIGENEYYESDLEVVQTIIDLSPTLKALYDGAEQYSWVKDGEFVQFTRVDSESAYKVQSLFFEELEITDIEGTVDVSSLDSLQTLILPDNKDVTAITLPTSSANFSYLNCGGTGIESLTVSGLSNLKILYCDRTNITELNVESNAALEELGCSSTKITTLNVESNEQLMSLYCSDTGLSQLDLSKNKKLQELHISNTNITSLDLSGLSSDLRVFNNNSLNTITGEKGTLTIEHPASGSFIFLDSYNGQTGKVSLTTHYPGLGPWGG